MKQILYGFFILTLVVGSVFGQTSHLNTTSILLVDPGTGNQLLLDPSGLTANRTFSFPDVSGGTIITTANLGSITMVGTVNSGTWNGNVIGSDYGGTGFNNSAFSGNAGKVLTINGTENGYDFTSVITPETSAGGDLSGSYPNPTINTSSSTTGDNVITAIGQSSNTIADANIADNLTVNGGTINASPIDASPIGATTESSGRFTTSEATTVLGAASTPSAGMSYRDNAIIAWGDIAAAGVVNDQFGNAVVAHTPGTGVYTVTLPNAPTAASTVATLQSLGLVTVTRAGSVITVTTYDTTGTPTDLDFYYITTGRP